MSDAGIYLEGSFEKVKFILLREFLMIRIAYLGKLIFKLLLPDEVKVLLGHIMIRLLIQIDQAI